MTNTNENFINYRGDKGSGPAVKSTAGGGIEFKYKPSNKKDTTERANVFERYQAMKSDPIRLEHEKQWDLGDKIYRMWAPERDSRDWRADIILPDGFSAVQSHMQETITLRPRPIIKGTEANDAPLEQFVGTVFNHAMDQTEFDQECYKARNTAAIRGTAFTLEEYRYETREVQMPDKWENGEIKYKKKTIVDYDDVYTRYIDNHFAFFDPGAEDAKYGVDCSYREVIKYSQFKEMYSDKDGYKDVDKVVPAGKVPKNVGYFRIANDIDDDDVELIHYWNKLTDTYSVLCNNVLIRNTPLPSTHKELPMDVWSFYPIPGQIYGMGIPFIIYTLIEERRSIRNLSLDRQKMHISKMFIVNDLFDISEDDLTPRPHGLIRLNTNGLPLNQAVMPLEYGDVPGSSLRMDESLKEDERRAHGMDDRPAMQQGGTATEAAIVKESAQQRINLINTLSNWNTMIRLGRKKWSNIQFYYPAKRMERVVEDSKTVDKMVYRNIKSEGKEYTLKGDEKKGNVELVTNTIPGWSSFRLEPTYAQYMDRNWDITMDAESMPVISQAIQRAQVNEMFQNFTGNPLLARFLDIEGIVKRVVEVNGESPKTWMLSDGVGPEEQRMVADQENELFMIMDLDGKIYQLPGTPNATEAHNEVHLDFMTTQAYANMGTAAKRAFDAHVEDEIKKNPALSQAAGLSGGTGQAGGNGVLPGQPGGPNVESLPMGTAATVPGNPAGALPL